MNKIELTDAEAQSFLLWRENQENWDIMVRSGVFNIANGSAQIHFNHAGQIASIDTHLLTFRRVKVNLSTVPTETNLTPNTEST